VDPHGWLDPANAVVWLNVIADELSELDPGNAETYSANAEATAQELNQLSDSISASLAPHSDKRFVVFHDAYQYFETRYGLNALGAISPGDAAPPSPARLAELRDEIDEAGAVCAFSEPQFNSGLIDAINTGDIMRLAVLDPLGVDLEQGPTLYPQLLSKMGEAFADCLGG
jgi:zinc transport system substrate-binding protein